MTRLVKRFPESLPEFVRMFPDEEHCAEYLEAVRWPDGFVCRYCDWTGEPYRFENRATILRCRNCQKDTSLTADTVMHGTRQDLATWFWAAYLVVTETPGKSALQFQRQLGLTRYETAFQMLHKLRAAMVRPNRDRIGGRGVVVEVDETYVGGETKGKGRGVTDQVLVAGAVEVKEREDGKSIKKRTTYAGRLRLHVVPSRKQVDLEQFVFDSVVPRSTVITDGWTGYDHIHEHAYKHIAEPSRGDPGVTERTLPMTHLIFSNLKAWIQGTHHGVSAKHLQAYLNEFTFRFNRRFYPMNAFHSILGVATQVEGPKYEELYEGTWIHKNPSRRAG